MAGAAFAQTKSVRQRERREKLLSARPNALAGSFGHAAGDWVSTKVAELETETALGRRRIADAGNQLDAEAVRARTRRRSSTQRAALNQTARATTALRMAFLAYFRPSISSPRKSRGHRPRTPRSGTRGRRTPRRSRVLDVTAPTPRRCRRLPQSSAMTACCRAAGRSGVLRGNGFGYRRLLGFSTPAESNRRSIACASLWRSRLDPEGAAGLQRALAFALSAQVALDGQVAPARPLAAKAGPCEPQTVRPPSARGSSAVIEPGDHWCGAALAGTPSSGSAIRRHRWRQRQTRCASVDTSHSMLKVCDGECPPRELFKCYGRQTLEIGQ